MESSENLERTRHCKRGVLSKYTIEEIREGLIKQRYAKPGDMLVMKHPILRVINKGEIEVVKNGNCVLSKYVVFLLLQNINKKIK